MPADRVFLDANVLFSASYTADSGLRCLWRLPETQLRASSYALEEARRNCTDEAHRERLETLITDLEIVDNPPLDPVITELDGIPESDRPILQAAVTAKASVLLTGDRRAFGAHFGKEIRSVRVLKPADYMRQRDAAAE